MNGAVTLGSFDGTNVELASEVGPKSIFLFQKVNGQKLSDRALAAIRFINEKFGYKVTGAEDIDAYLE